MSARKSRPSLLATPYKQLRVAAWAGVASAVLLLFGAPCAAQVDQEDLAIGQLAQGKRMAELVERLEGRLRSGKAVPTKQLYFLCEAYLDLRVFNELLACADRMERQISAGDKLFFGNSDLTAYPSIHRAQAYLNLGDFKRSAASAQAALRILDGPAQRQQLLFRHQLIFTLGSLGVAQALSAKRADALAQAERLSQVDLSASILGPERQVAIARIYIATGDYPRALAAIRDPAAVVGWGMRQFYDSTAQDLPRLYILNKSLYETGAVLEAKAGYDDLLKHPRIGQLREIHWLILHDRARIAAMESQPDKAIEYLKSAIEIIEIQRSSIDTEAGRIGFVGDKQNAYKSLVLLLLAEGRNAEAFEYVERGKSRALVDLLASRSDLRVKAAQPERARSALSELAAAEVSLRHLDSSTDTSAIVTRGASLVTAKRGLMETDPELASLTTVGALSVAQIQALLDERETVLEYYHRGEDLLVFVVTKTSVGAKALDGKDLSQRIHACRAAIADVQSTDHVRCTKELHQLLIAPIRSMISGDRLLVVPHGPLHYMPFAALNDGTVYMIDQFGIRLLPSASVLQFISVPHGGRREAMLLLGNPDLGKQALDLRFAQEEVKTISKGASAATVLLRKDASETRLKATGERYGVIHIAAHGLFDVDDPLGSALLLAPDGANDGRLTVAELYTLKLNADLVTLSACETALGRVANGDDVVGFTRGLLYAGTRSIVASLWSVEDRATRDLMVTFYGQLDHTDKANALRQAQLGLKRRQPHPFFWAAFQLVGSAD
jgi:CHAT domain-containing protein